MHGISLLPHFDGSVYGLKHMVEVMDSVGLVTVAKCCAGLTQALYPGGVKLQDSQDYREKMYVAVLYPTAFHGIAFSSGKLLDLIQNVDIIIQGAAFEKAVDQYTRRIKTELFAADHAKGLCADVKVYCKAPSRKKGDPDIVKSFNADAVRHPSTKKAFNSQVKTSTVAHRSITLELLLRTCMFKADSTVPKSTPEVVDSTVEWKFVRVKRNFTLHFQQQEKGWMKKEKTSGQLAKPSSTRR